MDNKVKTHDQAPQESRRLKLILALAAALTWPLAWLPAPLGLAWGAAAGRLVFRFWARRRRIAVANIEMIKEAGGLPADLPAEKTAREAFANLGRSGWETIAYYHRGLKPFWDYCHVEEGREILEKALAEARLAGRGLMLVTGHIGSWELICHYLPQAFDTSLTVIGRMSGRAWLDALVARERTMGGNGFISKSGGAREMIKELKSGGVLGTLIDQAAIGDSSGVSLPFLGLTAVTNLGPLRLARRTGAQVIMTLFHREGRHNYMKVFPLLEPRDDLPPEEALAAEGRQLNDWLGEHIQKYPDQWMWGHRRWKTRQGVIKNPDSLT